MDTIIRINAIIFLLYSVIIKPSISADSIHWDYHDPEHWGDLEGYGLCKEADESPINIKTEDATEWSGDQCNFEWSIEDHNKFKVENNGHSVVVTPIDYDEKSIAKFKSYVETEYCLDGFHFHWGTNKTFGSEHLIDAKHFPLEAHFVHYDCDYKNLSDAHTNYKKLDKGEDIHVLAVISILFKIVPEDNPAFDKILSDEVLSAIKYEGGKHEISGLDIRDIAPENIADKGYWTYLGSLTTPPCDKIVRWFIMKELGTISLKQLNKFHNSFYYKNSKDEYELVARNYRPLQTNKNEVDFCKGNGENGENGNGENGNGENGNGENGNGENGNGENGNGENGNGEHSAMHIADDDITESQNKSFSFNETIIAILCGVIALLTLIIIFSVYYIYKKKNYTKIVQEVGETNDEKTKTQKKTIQTHNKLNELHELNNQL